MTEKILKYKNKPHWKYLDNVGEGTRVVISDAENFPKFFKSYVADVEHLKKIRKSKYPELGDINFFGIWNGDGEDHQERTDDYSGYEVPCDFVDNTSCFSAWGKVIDKPTNDSFPHNYIVDGTRTSSSPINKKVPMHLDFWRAEVDDITATFKDGEVIKATAKKGNKVLQKFLKEKGFLGQLKEYILKDSKVLSQILVFHNSSNENLLDLLNQGYVLKKTKVCSIDIYSGKIGIGLDGGSFGIYGTEVLSRAECIYNCYLGNGTYDIFDLELEDKKNPENKNKKESFGTILDLNQLDLNQKATFTMEDINEIFSSEYFQ